MAAVCSLLIWDKTKLSKLSNLAIRRWICFICLLFSYFSNYYCIALLSECLWYSLAGILSYISVFFCYICSFFFWYFFKLNMTKLAWDCDCDGMGFFLVLVQRSGYFIWVDIKQLPLSIPDGIGPILWAPMPAHSFPSCPTVGQFHPLCQLCQLCSRCANPTYWTQKTPFQRGAFPIVLGCIIFHIIFICIYSHIYICVHSWIYYLTVKQNEWPVPPLFYL